MKNLIFTALALLACSSAAAAQSPLAEAARREAERRKAMETVKAPAAVPTFTNDDLAKLPPRPVPAVPRPAATEVTTVGTATPPEAAAASPAAGAPGAPGAPGQAPVVRDEKYWRDRITQARSNLSRAEMFAESLQTRINSLSADLINRDDPAQREKIAQDRQKALDELAKVKTEITDFRKAITDIEDEARRLNVPPGWLR